MTYKVIKAFFDKTDNLKPYSKGDSYSSDDQKRIDFLIDKGFLAAKATKDTKATKKTNTKKKKKASE